VELVQKTKRYEVLAQVAREQGNAVNFVAGLIAGKPPVKRAVNTTPVRAAKVARAKSNHKPVRKPKPIAAKRVAKPVRKAKASRAKKRR
jgi:hypothetical protein